MFLPGLAVVFAGVLGGKGPVEHQVKTLVHELHVKPVSVSAATLRTLTHHGNGTREVVKKMHAEGVVAFEIVTGHGDPTLRLVVYDADGGLKTFSETSLGAHGLAADDLDVLKSNLADDVSSLGGGSPEPAPAPAPAPAPLPPAAKLAPAPVKAKPTPPPAPPATEVEIEMDAPPAAAPPPAHEEHAAKPTTTADAEAVSADEIEAMSAGSASAMTDGGSAPTTVESLHLGAAIGFGIASRYFTPSPSTVAAFTSSPVGAMQVEAHVQPTARTSLFVSTDRTLAMTTPMRDGSIAATTISRWEAAGTYALVHTDTLEIGPRIGAGRRTFAIDSMDPSRSPDGEYDYLMIGVGASAHLGPRVTLRAAAAFEPVVSGTEPTEMAFGEASRWAVDIGGALEYRPFTHLFARVAAEYQRFTWSWDQAGARGAGGAVDEYPSGTLSLGADY